MKLYDSEEQTKPKSDAETNEAIERILACARQEMDATKGQKSCDETEYVDTVEATAKDSDEPQSSKTEQSTKECAIDASGANPTEFPPKNFLRKCPKVPGSRLTVLAHMRRMLITPLTQGDVMKYANCDTQVRLICSISFLPFEKCIFALIKSQCIINCSQTKFTAIILVLLSFLCFLWYRLFV